MMVFTIFLVAVIVVARIYFMAIQFIRWPGLSYALMVVVGVAQFMRKSKV